MLNELKIDEILDSGKVDSRYGLVLAAAKRARQINEYTATLGLNDSLGIPGPQVHTRSQNPLSIAIEELREGKLKVGFRETSDAEEVEEAPVSLDEDLDAADAASGDEAGSVAVEAAGEDATVESAAGEGEQTDTEDTVDSEGAGEGAA